MDYELRAIDESAAGIAACAALLKAAFPNATHLTAEYLRWQYLENPAGHAVGFNAYAGDALAGHYVTLPIVAKLEGQERRALLSLNTATHPAHQGKGLFTRLAEATFDRATQQGFDFVLGVANANSTPGFVRKLGFQLVSPLDVRLGIGNRRVIDAGDQLQLSLPWSDERLQWRLLTPGRRYWLQRLAGRIAIESSTGRPGIRVVLAELSGVAPPDISRGRFAALARPIRMWMGLDSSASWRKAGYLELPAALRPSPLNLIYRPLQRVPANLDSARLSFQALDFDAY